MASRQLMKDGENAEGAHHGCLIPHVLMVVVLLAGIAYALALAAAHTDGFRSYVQDRLEKVVGMPLRVGRIRATPALTLILETVTGPEQLVAGMPGLQAGKIVLAWSFRGLFRRDISNLRRVELQDVYLSLSADENGQWQPSSAAAFAARLCGWLGAAVPEGVGESELSLSLARVELDMKEVRIVWWDRDGERAQLTGIEGQCSSVRLGRREVLYRDLSAESVSVRGAAATQNARTEFIEVGDRVIVF